MLSKATIAIAKLFRLLPDFRGKVRLGTLLERIVSGRPGVSNVKIQLKRGDVLYVDPRSHTHKSAFWTGRYDDHIIDEFTAVFERDWVVMDVGANIGYYTIPFAKKLRQLGGGRVIAVEPLRSNIEKLRLHIDINNVNDIVEVKTDALGNKNGTISIFATEQGGTGNAYISEGRIPGIDVSSSDLVAEVRLDDAFSLWGINRCEFIKMDIEGAEILLLQGGIDFIKKFKPSIYGEFNSRFMSNLGYDFLDVASMLLPVGYKPFVREGKFYKEIRPEKGLVDVLFVPSERLAEFATVLI